jgi:hypothetical protein
LLRRRLKSKSKKSNSKNFVCELFTRLVEKVRNSDDIHTAEMEIQKLEFEGRISQRDEAIEELTKKVNGLTKRLDIAEANQKKDDSVSLSQEELEKFKKTDEELRKEIEQKDKMIEELQQEVEQYNKDNENKANEIESLKIDIETIQVEKTIAEEEKQIMEEEMRQQEEDRLKSMEETMTDDELRYQNEKLRIALRKLNNDVEVERAQWEEEKKAYEEQVERIPELEEKLGDIDMLLEAVEEREEEIEAMKETVQEATEFQQMVEELTEEIMEKEEAIEELESRVAELEEMQAVQEEINANQEAYEREMQNELSKKDVKIQELENDVQILEEALLEQDDKETKHKERITEINKENELLKDQLNAAYDDKTKNKISELIDKQKKLSMQLRESTRKEISGSLAEINVGISNTLADLYQSFIPEKLLREGYISNFNKIRLVIYVKNKAQLTFNELCKKKFIEGSDFTMGEGETENYEYFKYLCTLGNNSIHCLILCQKILHSLTFMDTEAYKKISDSSFWQNFIAANSFLDNMIKMIKEDTLTTKITQNSFEETLEEFDKFYQDNIRKEVNSCLQESMNKSDFDIDEAPKNQVKEAILKIGLAVLALGFYLRQRDFHQGKEIDKSMQEKCSSVYWKITEAVQAIDEIEQDDHGEEHFKSNANVASRLKDKFAFVSSFWQEDSMAFDKDHKDSETTEETKEDDKSEGDTSHQDSPTQLKSSNRTSKINYDWYAWIDSVERDMLSAMSEKSMQELREKVKEENPSSFLKKMSKGPWIKLAGNVKEALSKSDSMKEENEKMKEKIKEQNVAFVKLKKTKEDLEVIKDTLERKIAALELDSQKFAPLLSEKKRLEDKLNYIQGELDAKEKIINTQKDKINKLANEKEAARKDKTSDTRKSTSKKEKDKRAILDQLLKTGPKKRKSEAIADDSAVALIDSLQEENIKLKRSKLFERVMKLSESSPSFNQFMKTAHGDMQELSNIYSTNTIKLTDEEQAEIHSSLNEINGIKYSMRHKM